MWLNFEEQKHLKLREATMVIAVSTSIPQYRGLYSQARELAEYMLKKMKFQDFATLHSSAFPPEVLVRGDGISSLPASHFHVAHGKRDLVLFSGDASPMDDQYEFSKYVLEYARKLGVSELFSLGARWAETPLSPEVDPEPSGFSTDSVGVANLRKNGVKVLSDEPAPFFSSMVVAMARDYGLRGYKISVDHGEPSPHARSVTRLLNVLSAMAGFDIELDELKSQAKPVSRPGQQGESRIYQ